MRNNPTHEKILRDASKIHEIFIEYDSDVDIKTQNTDAFLELTCWVSKGQKD